jgi:hypothetical protein
VMEAMSTSAVGELSVDDESKIATVVKDVAAKTF